MKARPLSIWTGFLASLWRDEEAVTTVEYALLLGVLVMGSLISFGQLGDEAAAIASKCSDALNESAGMGCYPG